MDGPERFRQQIEEWVESALRFPWREFIELHGRSIDVPESLRELDDIVTIVRCHEFVQRIFEKRSAVHGLEAADRVLVYSLGLESGDPDLTGHSSVDRFLRQSVPALEENGRFLLMPKDINPWRVSVASTAPAVDRASGETSCSWMFTRYEDPARDEGFGMSLELVHDPIPRAWHVTPSDE